MVQFLQKKYSFLSTLKTRGIQMNEEIISMYEDLGEYLRMDGREYSCFFTGHRKIPDTERANVLRRLNAALLYVYCNGVREFHTGGALGFDTLAAASIIDLKKQYPDVRLILELPYLNQDQKWDDKDKRFYRFILSEADEVNYAFKDKVFNYFEVSGYMYKRNRSLVSSSHYGITYYNNSGKGGTAYTFSLAKKAGCELINLFE